LGEFGLINRIKEQAEKTSSVIKGIGDDAAVLAMPTGKCLLVTTDMVLEGVHFTKKMPAGSIGHKVLAASISDIAAMGGTAKYAVISLGVPASCSWQFVSRMYQGIHRTAKKFKISIVGGDTVRSPKIIINVALVGVANRNEVVYRSGARKGDHIFVTGPLGRSLSSQWHYRFIPRLAQAQYLVKKSKPTAMIDVSDGLAADLGHILTESKVGAILEESCIPLRRGARLRDALYDGEDFELLFTLPPLQAQRLQSRTRQGYSFYCIGNIVDQKKGLQIKTKKGGFKKIKARGYTHF
jgi:thiamine-monophosphate kinase